MITKEPNIAIFFAIISDGFAAVPTLIKSFKYPETETVGPFLGGLISSISSFFAIVVWDFSSLAFPLYLIFVNSLLIFTILKKNKKNG